MTMKCRFAPHAPVPEGLSTKAHNCHLTKLVRMAFCHRLRGEEHILGIKGHWISARVVRLLNCREERVTKSGVNSSETGLPQGSAHSRTRYA
jgi:hypothetical protein